MPAPAVFDLSGRVALVTGSSRGIGRALATGLLEAGAAVVLNGRDPGRLETARADLAAATGGTVHAVVFDAADAESVRAGVARAEEIAGPIDVLVNNAGAQHRVRFTEMTDDAWHGLLEANLTSAFFVGREVARRMVPRGHGKIVNICSLQSELARAGTAAYAATKGGLKMLTQGMCADLAGAGIQVNGIGPGFFATELTSALVADEAFGTWLQQRTPAGRWGDVDRDLAGALVFLSSPAADFVNGQIIYVDGGLSAVM